MEVGCFICCSFNRDLTIEQWIRHSKALAAREVVDETVQEAGQAPGSSLASPSPGAV